MKNKYPHFFKAIKKYIKEYSECSIDKETVCRDAEALTTIWYDMERGDMEGARQIAGTLDTLVRDVIPKDVWLVLQS